METEETGIGEMMLRNHHAGCANVNRTCSATASWMDHSVQSERRYHSLSSSSPSSTGTPSSFGQRSNASLSLTIRQTVTSSADKSSTASVSQPCAHARGCRNHRHNATADEAAQEAGVHTQQATISSNPRPPKTHVYILHGGASEPDA